MLSFQELCERYGTEPSSLFLYLHLRSAMKAYGVPWGESIPMHPIIAWFDLSSSDHFTSWMNRKALEATTKRLAIQCTCVTFRVCYVYIVLFLALLSFGVPFAPLLGRCLLADSTANHHSDVMMSANQLACQLYLRTRVDCVCVRLASVPCAPTRSAVCVWNQ